MAGKAAASSLSAAFGVHTTSPSISLVPFLYQTRTLQRCWERSSFQRRAFTSRDEYKDEEESHNPLEGSEDRIIGPEEGRERHASELESLRKGSTITKTERQTFARIFDEIMSSSTKYPTKRRDESEGEPRAQSVPPSGEPASGLDAIFQSAMSKARQQQELKESYKDQDITGRIDGAFEPSSPNAIARYYNQFDVEGRSESGPTANQESQQEQLLMRYPKSLRKAAARAAGFRPPTVMREPLSDEDAAEPEVLLEPNREVEIVRLRELKRIEDMLTQAQSGAEVLNVLERELLPQLSQLDNPTSKQAGKKKRRGRKAKKTTSPEEEQAQESESIPPLAILGINYPHLLLLAARLLRNTHNSPVLALSLFARVKSLSSISYVLGATTALYNEILKIRWYNYRDFGGVDELLQEMERNGVEFDARTEAILKDANLQRRAVERGEQGRWQETLWAMEGAQGAAMRMRLWGQLVKERLDEVGAPEDSSQLNDR
ncbi:MAG: hypothetical protein M4579_006196 [Chaenotheca gracillima]|nr:MAG: hypothetical protein M4579_006196 [Chaenotheca gracillima]